MDIRIIGIGSDCSNIINRLVQDSRVAKDTGAVIVDTDDRLVNSPYRQIPLQKEFIRKLNQGFYVSVLDPISMADKWEKSRKSGDKAKLREQCTNLVREIISFIGDADMVLVISGMAGEAGSRVTQEVAFAVKYCNSRKCVVLDRRLVLLPISQAEAKRVAWPFL